MKTNNSLLFLFFIFLFAGQNLFSAPFSLDIEGEYLIRFPGSSKAVHNHSNLFPDNAIYSVPNEEKASDTILLLDGHRIKLHPGASFKVSKGLFIPLVGRFEFSTKDNEADSVNIVANNCNAAYTYGHFLIEATPDNGIFFALKNKGSAWVKDIFRNVYDLKQGQQVQVPLYGKSVLKSHVESFWGKKPSSFGHLGEVGQETAYGIAGTGSGYSSSSKKSSDISNSDEKENDEDEENIENNEEITEETQDINEE